MTEKKSHRITNGIIAIVIGGLLFASVQPLRDLAAKLISRIWSGIISGWAALFSDYLIPGWIFILIGPLSLIGLLLVYRALRPSKEPEFKKYIEDSIYGAQWRWSWSGNSISDLWCYCPRCDARLICDDVSCGSLTAPEKKTDLICEKCRMKITTIEGGDESYTLGTAEEEILRRTRTNEFYPLY
jgi:hypothetical protein